MAVDRADKDKTEVLALNVEQSPERRAPFLPLGGLLELDRNGSGCCVRCHDSELHGGGYPPVLPRPCPCVPLCGTQVALRGTGAHVALGPFNPSYLRNRCEQAGINLGPSQKYEIRKPPESQTKRPRRAREKSGPFRQTGPTMTWPVCSGPRRGGDTRRSGALALRIA